MTCLSAGCEHRRLFDVETEQVAQGRQRRSPAGEEGSHEPQGNKGRPRDDRSVPDHEPCEEILHRKLPIGMDNNLDRPPNPTGKGLEGLLDFRKRK